MADQYALIVGLGVALACASVWFLAVYIKDDVVPWLSNKILEWNEKSVQMGRMSPEKAADRRKANQSAWLVVGLALVGPPSLLVLAFVPKPAERDPAETLANGIYGATVINCYAMNDFELLLNRSRCEDALARVKAKAR